VTADKLLSRLEGVRSSGRNRWRARCPSCGGKNASKLSVCDADDGRVLLHCFAGCEVSAIVGALGLDLTDLFPPKPVDHGPRVRKPWAARDVVAALRAETMVGWVLLTDIANGKVLAKGDRERARVAAERAAHLMRELEGAA
jgi:hypothetical protein